MITNTYDTIWLKSAVHIG